MSYENKAIPKILLGAQCLYDIPAIRPMPLEAIYK